MRLIRHGICRDVLLVGRWAVKVPTLRYGVSSWCRGYLANESERQWSGTQGVAPVLWSLGGVVNVYPRCEPLSDEQERFYEDRHHRDDWRKYRDVAPDWPGPDRKPDNLGVLNGQVVWVDYDGSWNGCPHSRWAHDLRSDEDLLNDLRDAETEAVHVL